MMTESRVHGKYLFTPAAALGDGQPYVTVVPDGGGDRAAWRAATFAVSSQTGSYSMTWVGTEHSDPLLAVREAENISSAGVRFLRPKIYLNKLPETGRPADQAGSFAKDALAAWLALPSPAARVWAFNFFCAHVASNADKMVVEKEGE